MIQDTNKKVRGSYDRKGYFVVDADERDVVHMRGRTDSEGYLLDSSGSRYRSLQIKERKKQRRFMQN